MAAGADDFTTLAALARLHQQCLRLDQTERDTRQAIDAAVSERTRCMASIEAAKGELRSFTLRSRDVDRETAALKQDSSKLKHVVEAAETSVMMSAAERELATKTRQYEELENEGFGILERIEKVERQITSIQQRIETVEASRKEHEKKLEQVRASNAVELERLKKEIADVVPQLSDGVSVAAIDGL